MPLLGRLYAHTSRIHAHSASARLRQRFLLAPQPLPCASRWLPPEQTRREAAEAFAMGSVA